MKIKATWEVTFDDGHKVLYGLLSTVEPEMVEELYGKTLRRAMDRKFSSDEEQHGTR